jgi:hypothetical protein
VRSPGLSARLAFFALTFGAASSFGGEIYGTIKENGKPVEKGLSITITPGADKTPKPPEQFGSSDDKSSRQTDQFGSYRIFVSDVGPCTLYIMLKKDPKEIAFCVIQSYSKPTRFDLVLQKINDQYVLQRQ